MKAIKLNCGHTQKDINIRRGSESKRYNFSLKKLAGMKDEQVEMESVTKKTYK